MDRPVEGLAHRIDLASHPAFQLGHVSIDPPAHEARFDGQVERLQPQTMKVLIALAERAGHPVSRDDLVERCWNGRYVGDDVINRAVLLLRRVADRAGGFTIETIPKTGYRLVVSDRRAGRGDRWPWMLALGATLGVILLAVSGLQRPATPQPPSVALKPFTSGPEQDARDIAAASGEALSHMLLAGSFPPHLDWPATEDALASDDLIMSGDVRRIGDRYNAVVQVRDRATNTVIFSRQYNVSDKEAGDLPERIGASMSSNLTGALAMLVLDRRHPVKPEIAADILKQIGMTIEGQDPLAGYAISRRLAARDPDSPLPQISLAFDTGFALGALPRADRVEAVRAGRVAAERAKAVAPEFGDTYVPWCLLHPKVLVTQCEDRMRAGMKIDPDAPFVPMFLANLLQDVGRNREALELARATLSDHPYQPHKLRRVVGLLLLSGQTEDAERLFAKVRRWWPDHPAVSWDRLMGYVMRGDIDGASRAMRDMPAEGRLYDLRRLDSIVAAWRAGSASGLGRACRDRDLPYEAQLMCLAALARTGDRDTAFAITDRFFPTLVTGSPAGDEARWLDDPDAGPEPALSAPSTRWLRSDPRYLALVRRTGLAAYWRSGRWPDFCTLDHEAVCKSLGWNG